MNPDVKLAVKPYLTTVVNPDLNPAIKPDAKPDLNPVVKPDLNSDVQPDLKPDIKPELLSISSLEARCQRQTQSSHETILSLIPFPIVTLSYNFHCITGIDFTHHPNLYHCHIT